MKTCLIFLAARLAGLGFPLIASRPQKATWLFSRGLPYLRNALVIALVSLAVFSGDCKTVYQNDFHTNAAGPVPEDFLVIAGDFAIKGDGTNKFLELPGEPLDSFGLLFGPTLNAAESAVSVSARVCSAKTGRRYPTLAVGLGNQGGFRVQISPAKGALEIIHGDISVTNTPFEWKSGQWTFLKITVGKAGDKFKVEGKAWLQGEKEPEQSQVIWMEEKEISPGRPSIWGSPFSTKPIQYDDLLVTKAGD